MFNLCDKLDWAVTEEIPKYTTNQLISTSPIANVIRSKVLDMKRGVRRRVLPITSSCYVLGARNLWC